MRLGVAKIGDLRVLFTKAFAVRGGVIAVLMFGQRVLAPAAAWTIFGRDLFAKIALGVVLSLVFTAHALAQRAFLALGEAELFDRSASAVLGGDVLRSTLLPDEDLRGELVQAIYQTAQLVSQGAPNLLADGIACVVLAIVVLAAEPLRIVAVAIAITLAAAGTLLFSRQAVERAVARAWAVQARVFEAFVDVVDGRLEIVASGHEHTALRDLREQTSAWGAAGVKVATSGVLSSRLPMLAIAGLVGTALACSPTLRQSSGVTLADVALFASVTPAFAGVAQGLHGFARTKRWAQMIARLLQSAEERPAPSTRAPCPLPAPIAFQRVSFRYDAGSDEDILHEVSFALTGAGALALAGSNGSGKSTCLRLLMALAAPREGTVEVGGTSLAEVNPDAWRSRVAFLPQRPYLPPRASVRRAIRWLAPSADDARILRALDRVGITASLRRAADDPLEARVDALSVGQRQRVALARLLCRDADLVVLDEPDANLDRAGIALVADVLRDLARDRMVVFAAHTPELLDVADRVVTLEGGRVVAGRAPAVHPPRSVEDHVG